MNEIEPFTSRDDASGPEPAAGQPMPAERAMPAPLPELPTAASAPGLAPSRTDQALADAAHPGEAGWHRRGRLWSFVKDKAGDLLDRITSPEPAATSPAASHNEPAHAPEAAWSAVSRSAAADALPASLHQRYFIAENKFYFRDREQALAFEDRGSRIVTVHNDPDIARSMVELALAKDWTTLRLKGTDEFKREAWLAAALRGLDVRGYRPTELDKARLSIEIDQLQRANVIEHARQFGLDLDGAPSVKQLAEAGSRQEPAAPPAAGSLRQQAAIRTLEHLLRARGDSEDAIHMTTQIAADQLQQRRVYVGKLLDHGPARFDNKPLNEHSYFVHLDTGSGEKTLWGVDLERAIASSNARRGDDIVIAQQDSRQVTVPQLVRDSTGQPTGEKVFIEATRNDWLVRTVDGMRDTAAERPVTQPQHAVRDRERAVDRTPFER